MSDPQPSPRHVPAVRAPSAPQGGIAMRALAMIWRRRHMLVCAVHRGGAALAWLYDKFPLPQRAKEIVTELTFHAIEHFIVQSESYQRWLGQRNGLGHVRHLFRSDANTQPPAPTIVPTQAEWHSLTRQNPQDAAVAVIVPVYKGHDATLRCMYQLLSATVQTPFIVTVIDDASPDKTLSNELRALAAHGLFELIAHSDNQGFIRSVNEGMRHHASRDIVLLNADTEVYDGWLDRMMEALYSRDDIASVTPFSNNAELCSYPYPFRSHQAAFEHGYEALDALAAATRTPNYPQLPTAVGFCMAIRRVALDAVGAFDDATFGRGYGEENDWCLRAANEGWRHVLADNVFVRHVGSVSFEGDKRREINRSLRRLNARHPHYRKLVREFRTHDPLLPQRRLLDLARLAQHKTQHNVLMISHNEGGGTECHVQDLTRWLQQEGVCVYRLSPDFKRTSSVRIWHHDTPHTPNLSFDINSQQDALRDALKALGISHIHVHHLLGFPPSFGVVIERLTQHLRCAYDVTIHDYFFACPSINLLIDAGHFCDVPSEQQSQHWAHRHPCAAGRMPIWLWREQHSRLLHKARRVFAPSHDAAARIQAVFASLDVRVRPHPETIGNDASLYRAHKAGESLDVAIIGELAQHKGAHVVLEMARDAKQRDLPILFHVFGDSSSRKELEKTGYVRVHGRYEEGELYTRLQTHRCHVAFTPSVWAETYSYTLSLALHYQIFPVCFDLGAPAERLRECEWGHIVPREWMHQPAAVNDALLALNTTPAPKGLITDKSQQYLSIMRDYYQLGSAKNNERVIPIQSQVS